jgi:hypothetical protein
MDLSEIHGELVHEIRNDMGYLVGPARMSELGDIFDGLALKFEGLALCHLFELADETAFRENMARSGQSRRFFLRRSSMEKNDDDRHLALSRNRAFLDAVISGSTPLARDIALLSTETWRSEWEYEDDFCFYLLLHSLAKQPTPFPVPEQRQLLGRFERALEGGESPQFEAASALVARDVGAFSNALLALTEAEGRQIEKNRDSAAVHERDILFWPKSRVSIEGLALLKIANLAGLSIEGEFPLCPRLALSSGTERPHRDLFEEMETLR